MSKVPDGTWLTSVESGKRLRGGAEIAAAIGGGELSNPADGGEESTPSPEATPEWCNLRSDKQPIREQPTGNKRKKSAATPPRKEGGISIRDSPPRKEGGINYIGGAESDDDGDEQEDGETLAARATRKAASSPPPPATEGTSSARSAWQRRSPGR